MSAESFAIRFNSADGEAVIETLWYAESDQLAQALAAVIDILGQPASQETL